MRPTVVFAAGREQRHHGPKIGQVVNRATGSIAFARWRGIQDTLVQAGGHVEVATPKGGIGAIERLHARGGHRGRR